MAVQLHLRDSRDAARVVDALLLAAECTQLTKPMLSRRYVMLADDLGDAIQLSGLPVCNRDRDPLDPGDPQP